MTEKRFTIKLQDDLFGVVDNYSADKVCVVNGIRTEIEAEWLYDLLNELNDENIELHIQNDFLKDENIHMRNVLSENKELKQRNNRQAKQLDRLYNLIEEKDWRTLTDIIDDFKRCEEQLQREWKCYE